MALVESLPVAQVGFLVDARTDAMYPQPERGCPFVPTWQHTEIFRLFLTFVRPLTEDDLLRNALVVKHLFNILYSKPSLEINSDLFKQI